jgi:hypothetical protein
MTPFDVAHTAHCLFNFEQLYSKNRRQISILVGCSNANAPANIPMPEEARDAPLFLPSAISGRYADG